MTAGLVLLDEAAVRRLNKAVGSNSDLLAYLGEWLLHLNLFTDAQTYDILRFVKSGIEQFELESKPIPTTLGVHDSRYVSFSRNNKFLDTQNAEEVEEMPHAALTHIFCDIVALQERMTYRQGRFNASRRSGNKPAEADGKAG
jgi:hypothetical protein